jgi:hypothetical protein
LGGFDMRTSPFGASVDHRICGWSDIAAIRWALRWGPSPRSSLKLSPLPSATDPPWHGTPGMRRKRIRRVNGSARLLRCASPVLNCWRFCHIYMTEVMRYRPQPCRPRGGASERSRCASAHPVGQSESVTAAGSWDAVLARIRTSRRRRTEGIRRDRIWRVPAECYILRLTNPCGSSPAALSLNRVPRNPLSITRFDASNVGAASVR